MKFGNQKEIDTFGKQRFAKLLEISLGWDEKGNLVENNDICDISFLKECVMLQILEIWHTKTKDLHLLDKLKLKYIQICGCMQLQNLNGLENCYEIEEISFRYLDINSIAAIRNLKQLKKVTIYECNQITDYNVLENCTGIIYLRIESSRISNLSPITSLKNLETLLLQGNFLLPEEFQKCIYTNKSEVQQLLWKYKEFQTKDQSLKPAVVSLKPPTLEEQVKELRNQLQQQEQQRQQDIQNQTTQMNQQIQSIQRQMQQQFQDLQQQMTQQMYQMIQQVNNQVSQVSLQIQYIRSTQEQKYDTMNKAFQKMKTNQTNDKQEVYQKFTTLMQRLQSDE